jgi:hypothetical protein
VRQRTSGAFLAEVDQARKNAKLLEADLTKERKRRLQVEEAAAVERTTSWVALEEAKRSERKLRLDDLLSELRVCPCALIFTREGRLDGFWARAFAESGWMSNFTLSISPSLRG